MSNSAGPPGVHGLGRKSEELTFTHQRRPREQAEYPAAPATDSASGWGTGGECVSPYVPKPTRRCRGRVHVQPAGPTRGSKPMRSRGRGFAGEGCRWQTPCLRRPATACTGLCSGCPAGSLHTAMRTWRRTICICCAHRARLGRLVLHHKRSTTSPPLRKADKCKWTAISTARRPTSEDLHSTPISLAV